MKKMNLKTKERHDYLIDVINTLSDANVFQQERSKFISRLMQQDVVLGNDVTEELVENRAIQFAGIFKQQLNTFLLELEKLGEVV
jgi:hypothetical protein